MGEGGVLSDNARNEEKWVGGELVIEIKEEEINVWKNYDFTK